MSDPVILDRLEYGDLTPYESDWFHSELGIGVLKYQGLQARMGEVWRRLEAARDAGEKDIDDADLDALDAIPLERVGLLMLVLAARRHTGNHDLTAREIGNGQFEFRKPTEDDPKGEKPVEPRPVE